MYTQVLTKPDGRTLTLYARAPFPAIDSAPSPSNDPHQPNSHLRWHPLRGE